MTTETASENVSGNIIRVAKLKAHSHLKFFFDKLRNHLKFHKGITYFSLMAMPFFKIIVALFSYYVWVFFLSDIMQFPLIGCDIFLSDLPASRILIYLSLLESSIFFLFSAFIFLCKYGGSVSKHNITHFVKNSFFVLHCFQAICILNSFYN